jgi:hypothetical protein
MVPLKEGLGPCNVRPFSKALTPYPIVFRYRVILGEIKGDYPCFGRNFFSSLCVLRADDRSSPSILLSLVISDANCRRWLN